jgi:hypothetical protein
MEKKRRYIYTYDERKIDAAFVTAFLVCVLAVLIPFFIEQIDYDATAFAYATYGLVAMRLLLFFVRKKKDDG